MYCDSRKPLLTCVNAAHGFRMVTSDSYGIRRISIATTQSHHQGRASKHEHGDTSHVQQHGAMPPVDGREEPECS